MAGLATAGQTDPSHRWNQRPGQVQSGPQPQGIATLAANPDGIA